jgi:hypothetical protein
MSKFKVGDRVKVVSDLTGVDAFVGREGVITAEAKYYRRVLAVDPAVRLDGRDPVILRDLHFAPEELELLADDAPAPHDPADCATCDDHADATTQADRDDRIGGGQ